MKKKLSIITVVYNGERYIEDAIKSVLEEKYEDVEYIIIDGGSKDETMSIINRYKDNIDVIISEPDKGIYDAMNKGVNFSSGEYVVFLNSDDYYKKGTLDSCLKALASSPDALIMNTFLKSEHEEKIFKRIENKENYNLYIQIPFMHPSVVVKRSIFNEIGGFDLKYRIASDCDFLLKMISRVSSYTYIDNGIVMREGGVSDTSFKEGRIEYRLIYAGYSGSKFQAWRGYFESIFFYNLRKFVRFFK